MLTNPVRTRKILLFEGSDSMGRLQTMGGIVDNSRPTLNGTLVFADPITENPQVGDTEIWEFYNTTADAHPIHMHLVDFRILNRQKFSGTNAGCGCRSDRKSTRLNSSHRRLSRMPSSA